jgi:hypothetical protein
MFRRNGRWRSAEYRRRAYGRYRAARCRMGRRQVVFLVELDRCYHLGRLALRRLSNDMECKEGRVGLERHSSPVKPKEST